MNLVQEMPKLEDLVRLPEAIERLQSLFEVMQRQPGFLSVEVLQNVATPETLLVLHAWRDLADWDAFSRSKWKVDFMAARPKGLYDMQPCGMNWRSVQADGPREGGSLRREVLRGDNLPLRHGAGIAGGQTFVYQDELPQFAGATLRLTRLDHTENGTSNPEPDAIADELYTSLFSVRAEHPTAAVSESPAAS